MNRRNDWQYDASEPGARRKKWVNYEPDISTKIEQAFKSKKFEI